jgi:hypothetical protein
METSWHNYLSRSFRPPQFVGFPEGICYAETHYPRPQTVRRVVKETDGRFLSRRGRSQ